ncbi:tRNA pseudouridine(55) synthase TruB [Alkalicoccus halolimnae]|uniref:tRNA pseudouridine synthase B n=1 Tax=Alkalicoccus halolimnae TaxID=1667239 RepID=A0A5C7FLU1_9BACI|nr:tRNA pseudouridine(55) synthase TruB [Alkalicoccus halolimnae]TXF87334.1 tRNA pseudouridine(55) synthase TruB [Alkalicoccus halolimnae]
MKSVGGVVPLWKPRGMTSFDAVKRVRHIYKTKRAGHTGTLDPDVEGVLPICLERATKLVEYLTADQKVYEGEVTIGFSTETEDAGGEVVERTPVNSTITEEEADSVLADLQGELEQTPPMYSAVKVKGKKLYEYAREGLDVARPVRTITIYSLERKSALIHEDGKVIFSFRAVCSKGTYIRTLAVQIGEKLGYAAHMSDLIRTASGNFEKKDCITLEELEKMNDPQKAVISVENAVKHLPGVIIDEELEKKVLQGGLLPLPKAAEAFTEPYFSLYNRNQELLALYKKDVKRDGMMKPEKMIRTIDL